MRDCPLSPRQRQVLELIAAGMEISEVAAALGVSASGVRSHLANVAQRAGTSSTLQSVLVSVRRGWISAPPLDQTDELVWRQRLERCLLSVIELLEQLVAAEAVVPSEWREYLAALDEHLATRHWDEIGLAETSQRAHRLARRLRLS